MCFYRALLHQQTFFARYQDGCRSSLPPPSTKWRSEKFSDASRRPNASTPLYLAESFAGKKNTRTKYSISGWNMKRKLDQNNSPLFSPRTTKRDEEKYLNLQILVLPSFSSSSSLIIIFMLCSSMDIKRANFKWPCLSTWNKKQEQDKGFTFLF